MEVQGFLPGGGRRGRDRGRRPHAGPAVGKRILPVVLRPGLGPVGVPGRPWAVVDHGVRRRVAR